MSQTCYVPTRRMAVDDMITAFSGSARIFFCGHINIHATAISNLLETDGWEKECLSSQELGFLRGIYYESFIDSLTSGQEDAAMDDFYAGTSHLTKEIGKVCRLQDDRFSQKAYSFNVCRLHLFFFLYRITLFVVETDVSEVNLNDLTLANGILRDVCGYDKLERTTPEYISELQPLLRLCTNGDESISGREKYANLTCMGNKLKVFQIIRSSTLSDELLFELGTLSPIGCVSDKSSTFSPSPEYFKSTIEEYRVSIFRNWKALALFDTFTALLNPGCHTFEIWIAHYFRLIYIHVLYQKTLLFVLNKRFRSGGNKKNMQKLLQDMKEQESHYAFSDISYNFLPQMLYETMDRSLGIEFERKKLHEILEQEAERQETQATANLTRVLTFLTILTSLSVLYDGSSLVREFIGGRSSTCCYQGIVIIFTILIIIGIYIVWRPESIKNIFKKDTE